jgi:sulfide:quinone oxidoreductase
MTLDIRWLTPKLAVCPQISASDIPAAQEAGFKSIICNRPDGEDGPQQPSQTEVGTAAEAMGLTFAYHPVNSVGHTPEQALHMGALLGSLPTPILAYCRSGARCANLVGLCAQLGQTIPK